MCAVFFKILQKNAWDNLTYHNYYIPSNFIKSCCVDVILDDKVYCHELKMVSWNLLFLFSLTIDLHIDLLLTAVGS